MSLNAKKRIPEDATFYYDDLLPSLPLPSIHQTIVKYLDSCKAVLTKEEYEDTELKCKQFMDEDATGMQVMLMQKAIKQRNWLAQWWLDKAYLETRSPIMYSYFSGPGPYFETIWPLQKNTQLQRSSIALYITMQLWLEMRHGTYPQHKTGDGAALTMHQFRYMFSTCRIPKAKKDEIHHSFKTAEEGDAPTHIIVFFRNRMYKLQAVNPATGEICTPPEFYKMLLQIKRRAPQQYGERIGALTCLERDMWASAREHMQGLSARNRRNLQEIESAIICFCLDESEPTNLTELLKLGLTDANANRWNDKSFNYIATANGGFNATNDHTPYEAMVLISFVKYTSDALPNAVKRWHGTFETAGLVEPSSELIFDVDDKLLSYVKQGQEEFDRFGHNLEVKMMKFDTFGKASLKRHKVHPDAFIQVCLQLAYMRKHGKPAPTYETATTRGFYRGRTETCRTCTPESVAFCKAMLEGTSDRYTLFMDAHEKFIWLMNECKQNRGCDRHLMGLTLQAMENGESLPQIFTDPAFVKTGGGGNFVLSTSLTGYVNGTGCVAPMVEDGYGIFYCIGDNHFYFTVSSWRSSPHTSTEDFMSTISDTFKDVHDVIEKEFKSKL